MSLTDSNDIKPLADTTCYMVRFTANCVVVGFSFRVSPFTVSPHPRFLNGRVNSSLPSAVPRNVSMHRSTGKLRIDCDVRLYFCLPHLTFHSMLRQGCWVGSPTKQSV